MDKQFYDFEEIVKWAWDEYKIDANFLDVMDDDLKHQACEQLELMIYGGKDGSTKH